MEKVTVDEFRDLCLKAILEIWHSVPPGYVLSDSIKKEMRIYLDNNTIYQLLFSRKMDEKIAFVFKGLVGDAGFLFGIPCADVNEGNHLGIKSNAVVWSSKKELYAIDSNITQVSYRFMAIPLPGIKSTAKEVIS